MSPDAGTAARTNNYTQLANARHYLFYRLLLCCWMLMPTPRKFRPTCDFQRVCRCAKRIQHALAAATNLRVAMADDEEEMGQARLMFIFLFSFKIKAGLCLRMTNSVF
jgi:hypothetical protein